MPKAGYRLCNNMYHYLKLRYQILYKVRSSRNVIKINNLIFSEMCDCLPIYNYECI